MSSEKSNPRMIAAKIVDAVLSEHRSLSECASPLLDQISDPRDRGLAQELSYGVLRWYEQLDAIMSPFLQRPMKKRDSVLKALLLIGAYQIFHLRTPEHAAVSSTVECARQSGRPWATSLLNGILRNLIRKREHLLTQVNLSNKQKYSHPAWFIEKIKIDWPDDWETILINNNLPASMSLRVNALKNDRDTYLARLDEQDIKYSISDLSDQGIVLNQSTNPTRLPGFEDGAVSVQDIAAQLATPLLDLKPDQNILDACAAPGGKTAHILETEQNLHQLVAIDITEKRVALLKNTLTRLELLNNNVRILDHDAIATEQWSQDQKFDRILLDAPCSATGVIRRHPDIKYHRKARDIDSLAKTQRLLLKALWPLLASGGRLVYVTCSVFKQENEDQISWFLSQQEDATELKISSPWGRKTTFGKQILPGDGGMDGFYYACLHKT
ncbi:MAG: 16S rRNA (cytosine(967)-C(5))-methyltransferase RsmB [Gammaproteobacteria bacterium]